MAHHRLLIAAVIAALALAGCAAGPSSAPPAGTGSARSGPAPAPAPLYAPGDSFVYDDGGTVTTERVVSTSPDRVVWTNDSGLIWTKDTAVVTPPLMWSDDPELGRGRQTIIGSPHQLFPLQDGNVIAYGVRGSSENAPAGWQDEHRCVVAGHEPVEVKAGRFDTYKIDCQRKDYRDTYFYAPTAQNYVLRMRQFNNRQARKELVSFSFANDRGTAAAPAPAAAPVAPLGSGTPASPAPPMPVVGEDGKMASEPRPGGTMSGGQTMELVSRLENVVSRLERLAGVPAAGGTAAAAKPLAGSAKPAAAATGAGGNWAVHLASYRSAAAAADGWKQLQRQYPQLQDKTMRTSEFDAGRGSGTYTRLLAAGFAGEGAAKEFCRPMVAKGQFCQAKGPLP